jgi:hypothetical protein
MHFSSSNLNFTGMNFSFPIALADPRYCTLSSPVSLLLALAYIFVTVEHQYGRLCGLMVRVPGYRTELYCDSCEVRTEFIYVM